MTSLITTKSEMAYLSAGSDIAFFAHAVKELLFWVIIVIVRVKTRVPMD